MKGINPIVYVGGAALVGVGIAMAAMNPSPEAYEDYAALQLGQYAKTDLCPKGQNTFGDLFQGKCSQLVEAVQPQLRSLIAQTTQRQNLGVVSIYRTELAIPFLSSYEFETVGVFNSFYTFKAEKK